VSQNSAKAAPSFADNLKFIANMIARPRIIGAISPSGPALAKSMASFVDLSREGVVLELGPGTGPVTKALLERGVPKERLLLLEYESEFCDLLAERYPGVKIVQGDAYSLKDTLAGHLSGPIAGVVSSLPLLVREEEDRLRLLRDAFDLMGMDGTFVQFTYGMTICPMPIKRPEIAGEFVGKATAPILLNLPPARVWRYRKASAA
jgi:phosphatidylethanolamine/phosphatidyl-N-methylethanolamine N-methyltransferase